MFSQTDYGCENIYTLYVLKSTNFPPPIYILPHITEILLKVALNTVTLTPTNIYTFNY